MRAAVARPQRVRATAPVCGGKDGQPGRRPQLPEAPASFASFLPSGPTSSWGFQPAGRFPQGPGRSPRLEMSVRAGQPRKQDTQRRVSAQRTWTEHLGLGSMLGCEVRGRTPRGSCPPTCCGGDFHSHLLSQGGTVLRKITSRKK